MIGSTRMGDRNGFIISSIVGTQDSEIVCRVVMVGSRKFEGKIA